MTYDGLFYLINGVIIMAFVALIAWLAYKAGYEFGGSHAAHLADEALLEAQRQARLACVTGVKVLPTEELPPAKFHPPLSEAEKARILASGNLPPLTPMTTEAERGIL